MGSNFIMKTLQERMNDMKPYFRGIEMYNEALIVRVMFPNKWKAYNSADERIKVTPSETNANEVFYYADSENTNYEDIFDLIEETIKTNKDVFLKIKLLKDKIDELKELFSKISYEELLTLRFETDKSNKTKPKRKYNKKKKIEEIVENVEEQTETIENNDEIKKENE